MKFRLLILFFSIIFLTNCKNDFKVNEDWKDYTVVYGLLNQNDSVNYVKITKSFLGEQDAYKTAKISDSLYYKSLTAAIEEWNNGNLIKTINLQKNTSVLKDTGIFANDYNELYSTTEKLNEAYTYKLIVMKEGKLITSQTNLVSNFNLIAPGKGSQVNLFAPTSNMKMDFYSPLNSKIIEVLVKFYYYEITATDTTKKYIECVLPTIVSANNRGGEKMLIDFTGANFSNNVASQIKSNSNVITRVVAKNSFTISINIGDDNLYTYMQVTQPATGIVTEKPTFTNINNGIGLFAARLSKNFDQIQLSSRTIDSLSFSKTYKDLKFLEYNLTFPLWSAKLFL